MQTRQGACIKVRRLAALLVLLLLSAVPAAADGMYNTAGNGGTATNDNACTGCVGEVIEALVANAVTTALSNNVNLNLTSITLTPGDWDVSGVVQFNGAATTTVTTLTTALSDTSATFEVVPVSRWTNQQFPGTAIFAGGATVHSVSAGPTRWSIATSTTVYLIARAVFATSTCQTYGGHIFARRRR